MALFKIYRGQSTSLESVPKTDGHAYFCTDDGSFWIDYKTTVDGVEKIERKSVNDKAIEQLMSLTQNNANKLAKILEGAPEECNSFTEVLDYIDAAIETIQETVPTKTSDLTNDSGFITDFEETDPTVPSHVKSITSTNISNWGTAYTHSQSAHAPSDAEKNVQSDWNVTDTTSDAYIKNKPTALKNPNALSIGGKSYDGSSTVSVTAADLGIANAVHFIGETTTDLTDGATTAAVTIDGVSKTPTSGDVVLYSSKEFIWNGSAWKELGDGSSHALKTIAITGGDGLAGGGDLSTNRTITHSIPNGAAVGDKGSTENRTYVKTVTTDKFGHVIGVTTGTETVTDTNQKVKAGSVTFEADDIVDFVAGSNVSISGNATNKNIQISAVDTTYDLSAPASKTNGNVTIDLKAGGSESGTDSVKIQGSGAAAVTTDSSGVITISSTDTDTGATSVEVTGSGNAITAASYDANIRKITLTRDATYTTEDRVRVIVESLMPMIIEEV
jgi:hypothetical protein